MRARPTDWNLGSARTRKSAVQGCMDRPCRLPKDPFRFPVIAVWEAVWVGVKTVNQMLTNISPQTIMKLTNSLLLVAALTVASIGPVKASDIIYQTGFEAPEFTPNQPLINQAGWLGGWYLPGAIHPTTISTVNARDGAQCVRFFGADSQGTPVGSAYAFRPIFDLNDPNAPPPPLITEIQVDARLDGPQSGSLGTPEQDILSANLELSVLQPNGYGRTLGGFFISSAGKIWTFGSRPEDLYKYSLPYTFGTYRRLKVRVDFIAHTLTYFVDGAELGSAPIAPEILSEKLIGGHLWLAGSANPIDTPELTYHRENYNAYFDNYSIASVPLTPADMVVQFAKTDYAVEEAARDASVEIIRRGYTNSAVSVSLNTADGTATVGKDYKAASTIVKFAPGETTRTVQVRIKDDSIAEPDETVMLALSAGSSGLKIPRSSAPLWILDDERAGSVDPGFQFNTDALGLTTLYGASSISPMLLGRFCAVVEGADADGNYASELARFRADGSVDSGFEPYPNVYKASPAWFGLSVIANLGDRLVRLQTQGKEDAHFNVQTLFGTDPGYIESMEVQLDLKVILAGYFDSVNGTPRQHIARVRATGDVDPSFDPGLSADDYISALALQRDGRVLIGGYFQNVGGQPRMFLARLNANGSLDPSFNPGDSLGESVYGFPSVSAIAVQRDGKILVGGHFDTYQGTTRFSLVRLMPNGALDASFDIGSGFESGFSSGTPGGVSGLAVQPDGKVLVSGGFGYFNGVWATGIVRLNANGSLDPTFQVGGNDSFAAPLNGGAPVLLLGGDILTSLSNNVSFIKDEPVTYHGIVRLNGDPSKQLWSPRK